MQRLRVTIFVINRRKHLVKGLLHGFKDLILRIRKETTLFCLRMLMLRIIYSNIRTLFVNKHFKTKEIKQAGRQRHFQERFCVLITLKKEEHNEIIRTTSY